ncbi:hypothetical protein SEA_ALANGRANT_43 [Mycobacterium phage AlanGrant]|nr:hypothetical protein SEA_ALANGRANT_43 [Mycobacterium phage AlanGrant]
MTITADQPAREVRPEGYEHGFGEIIRAHRMYVGLNQREMAVMLGKSRRDYQRIESGQDACPPGLLTKVEGVTDAFDDDVAKIIAAAEETANRLLVVAVSNAPGQEWHRLVAGRAAVIVADDDESPVITLTMSGNTPRERTA